MKKLSEGVLKNLSIKLSINPFNAAVENYTYQVKFESQLYPLMLILQVIFRFFTKATVEELVVALLFHACSDYRC